ncbi:Mrp/NBP35 family ATP-binding protein [Candidatus Poriferisodalis sp.]|uniref:Mrp/NBP35 family ATP-binding protein n=1 Tax=Candidatus Poriferisodalis sp. TaxID=3101277 RepID=UPI003B0275F4
MSSPADAAADDPAMIAILRGVMDPELGDNIVDLGMVRSARREGTVGHVTVALTTAGCPLRATIKRDCETRVAGLAGIESVRLHWDELNAAEKARVMERARRTARDSAAPTQVPAGTRVLAVASGKGGVGKSSVTVNVATSLARRGFVVGVLDADIWGFSIPRMLGMERRLGARPPGQGEQRGKIVPDQRRVGDGRLKVVSTGMLVETEETALMWRGLMLAKAVEQFLHDVDWGELDYLLIDMPPGTGDVQMALARLLPQAELLVVTTPALSAQKVAVRVADMARRSHMPIVGVVENMSAFTAPDGARWAFFGEGGGERLAADLGVPLLGSIPLEPAVSAGSDAGEPVTRARADATAALAAAVFEQITDRLVTDICPPVDMGTCTARMDGPIPVTIGARRS